MGRALTPTVGLQQGRLTLLRPLDENGLRWSNRWLCRCSCGSEASIRWANVRNGHTKSCGCLQREVTTKNSRKYRHTGKRAEYVIWRHMIDRCCNPKHPSFPNYGARGIVVCERWRNSFDAFVDDVGERPGGGFWLDRLDNEGGYEPGNVGWTRISENQRNKRTTRWLEAYGERLPLQAWAERLGCPSCTIIGRIKGGWTVAKAVTTPPRRRS